MTLIGFYIVYCLAIIITNEVIMELKQAHILWITCIRKKQSDFE